MSKPYTAYVNPPRGQNTFLGVAGVYPDEFARGVDEVAAKQRTAHKDAPLLLGYLIGNEPPWGDREGELVDMILVVRLQPPNLTKAS